MSENACRLCAVEKLTFEPPPIYCSACGARIKRNALYYNVGSGETRHYFCIPCYNDIRTETVEMDGMSYLKTRLEKKKNDEETEEAVRGLATESSLMFWLKVMILMLCLWRVHCLRDLTSRHVDLFCAVGAVRQV